MAKSYLNIPGYPIGLRNNNPGNLRTGDNWQGMIGENQNFVVFENIAWGIRALGKDLTTKINNGYDTIELILFRYAPPNVDNNNTLNYIAYVSRYTGWPQNKTLTADRATLERLARAIINFEIGSSYANMITDADIKEGFDLISGGGPGMLGPAGFTLSAGLLLFALFLFATMPKMPKAKSLFT